MKTTPTRMRAKDLALLQLFSGIIILLLASFCEISLADKESSNETTQTSVATETVSVGEEVKTREEPATDTTTASVNCTEDSAKPNDKPATSQKKSIKQTTDTEMRTFDLSAEKKCLLIKWSVGEKMLLSFWGEKYELSIYYHPQDLSIVGAEFKFKDTTDSDNVVSFNKKFKPPLNAEIAKILNYWLNHSLANLNSEEKQDDSLIVENFDLRPFYKKYVKSDATKQISK